MHEPGLTPRGLAVCARRLIGMLYEGIATDPGISLASVKTYRKRAFERLDIHYRNERYGIAIGLGRS
ncbi:MAG: LuxR C-terminal-related transcriptional regulator [Burkholderiaceae bacterium]